MNLPILDLFFAGTAVFSPVMETMRLEALNFFLAGTAALSTVIAIVAVCSYFSLNKRLLALEERLPAQTPSSGFTGEFDMLAGRLSSMQNSVNFVSSGLAQLETSLADVRSQLAQQTPHVGPLKTQGTGAPHAEVFRIPINLNRRGQTVRLHRTGESIPSIARTLGISEGEVKLTLRMQATTGASLGEEKPQNSLEVLTP